jgi:hypothetical protein
VDTTESHLRPDGTVWPPVTPDPPSPPGYRDPLGDDPDAESAGDQPAPDAGTEDEG